MTGSTNESVIGRVLVTGATGNVGAAVVTALRARNVTVRAADRHPDNIRRRFGAIEVAQFDFTDPATFGPALDDVRAVFLIRPPAIARVGPTLNRFVDVMASAGVEHVVFSSVAGAQTNRIVPHHRVERHLRRSPLAWTMLRPGFFAQNIGGAYRDDIVNQNRIYVPAGNGRVAFIDAHDLGEAAAIALTEDGYRGRGLHLTGPEAVTFDEVAAELTEVLGRTIRYEPATATGYLRHLRRSGLPLAQCVVQTVLHVGLRRGDAEQVTDELERVLGRPPLQVSDYLDRHRDRFVTSADR